MKKPFPKKLFLKKKSEFSSLFSSVCHIQGKYLSIHFSLQKEVEPRLGVSVSKRYGSSPKRNRFKRLIREIFRLHLSSFPKLKMNISPIKTKESLNFHLLKEDIFALFSKISS